MHGCRILVLVLHSRFVEKRLLEVAGYTTKLRARRIDNDGNHVYVEKSIKKYTAVLSEKNCVYIEDVLRAMPNGYER